MTISIPVQLLNERAIVPQYATFGDACFDLHACIDKPLTIFPGRQALIPTGLAFAVPHGYRMDIYARSGNAAKFGIDLGNCVGKIDAGYRGEVKVLLRNNWLEGANDFVVTPGMRIAQAEINPVLEVDFQVSDHLPQSQRGEGGFGSTGT